MNTLQIYNVFESKEQVLKRHDQLKQWSADKAEFHWTEAVQLSVKNDKWRPNFMKLIQEYESM